MRAGLRFLSPTGCRVWPGEAVHSKHTDEYPDACGNAGQRGQGAAHPDPSCGCESCPAWECVACLVSWSPLLSWSPRPAMSSGPPPIIARPPVAKKRQTHAMAEVRKMYSLPWLCLLPSSGLPIPSWGIPADHTTLPSRAPSSVPSARQATHTVTSRTRSHTSSRYSHRRLSPRHRPNDCGGDGRLLLTRSHTGR
jgi:hypothetical protein